MTAMSKDHKLFTEFPAISKEEWEKVVAKDLKGADYKKKLRWQTGEDVEALPFYRKEDFDYSPFPLSTQKNDWEIRERITEQDVGKANEMALQAIEGGATALEFTLNIRQTQGALGGDIHGTAVQNQDTFARLVDGIDLSKTTLHFRSGVVSPLVLAMLHNECENKDIDSSAIKGSLLYDPYAFVISNGQLPKEEAAFVDEAHQMIAFSEEHLPNIKCLGVNARPYHNAGGTIVQELGYALATGSEYLATLSKSGLNTDAIASAIHFNFSIGSNYFLEIAKFRAARKCWRSILDAYEVDDHHRAYLHGSSSAWNKTMYDPYVNMLRTTTEGMSAAIAGCDSITLHPFDKPFGQPDDFSRRIARNTQIVLKEEAYFDKVADPSAGSYYIEKLTDKIAEAAWKCFQEVEKQGGILKAIRGGYVQSAIEESRKERDQAIATRGRIFVGINQYPNVNDESTHNQQSTQPTASLKKTDNSAYIDSAKLMGSLKKALKNGCSLGDLVPALFDLKKYDVRPIRPYRGPQAFEALRQATENHSSTPKVLTLPLGNKKMRKARSAFAVNFFGCAGYEVEDPIGFEAVDEAVKNIKKQKPDIVVLCSSDEEYEKLVPPLCDKIDQLAEKPIVVLAGDPKQHIEEYRATGIDEFIHSKSNVLEILQNFQQKLGIINNDE